MRWPHFIDFYRLLRRAEAKAFSMASARSFSRFGARSVIEPPLRVWGEGRISIGDDVFVGAGSGSRHLIRRRRSLRSATARASRENCVLSAAVSIRLGKRVLFARNVYIADHMHTFEQAALPVLNQGIARRGSIDIGDGAWLGQNVVIGPGVRIGRGASSAPTRLRSRTYQTGRWPSGLLPASFAPLKTRSRMNRRGWAIERQAAALAIGARRAGRTRVRTAAPDVVARLRPSLRPCGRRSWRGRCRLDIGRWWR